MLSKKDLIERLRKHPLYKAALASVDAQQAQRIAALAEGFLTTAAEGLTPMIIEASDPKKVIEAQRILKEDGRVVDQVVNNIDPKTSGSKDD
jgi:hypothetical protein